MSLTASRPPLATAPSAPSALLRTDRPDTPLADLAEAVPPACLAAVLDEIDTGALICSARGHVLTLNEAARRELAGGSALRLHDDGSLGVRCETGLLALRRAIKAAALEGRHEFMPLQGGRDTSMVSVRPLRGTPDGHSLALLLLGRSEPCAQLAVLTLARLFDLTPSERDILSQLLAGVRITALAGARGVALSTVRCQVAALRMKLGVTRIDDMTRMAARLPPMLGVLRTPLSRCYGADADQLRPAPPHPKRHADHADYTERT